MVFHNVGLLWIIEKNNHINFEMHVYEIHWVYKVPWYNKTICKKIICQSFKDYFKIVLKDRYELMCSFDEYDKYNLSMTHDASSGGEIPMPSTSSKEELLSLGHKIKFIENWIPCFEVNYQNRIMIYKINISELFKTNPKITYSKKPDDYKAKFQTTIRAVGG